MKSRNIGNDVYYRGEDVQRELNRLREVIENLKKIKAPRPLVNQNNLLKAIETAEKNQRSVKHNEYTVSLMAHIIRDLHVHGIARKKIGLTIDQLFSHILDHLVEYCSRSGLTGNWEIDHAMHHSALFQKVSLKDYMKSRLRIDGNEVPF